MKQLALVQFFSWFAAHNGLHRPVTHTLWQTDTTSEALQYRCQSSRWKCLLISLIAAIASLLPLLAKIYEVKIHTLCRARGGLRLCLSIS
jgi:hypothetical protein